MDCTQNIDPLKLVREGTSRKQRYSSALDPAYAPVNERTPAHGMVFAQAYARYLNYYNDNNEPVDNWQPFFSKDISVQLAVAAVQDVDTYKTRIKETSAFLNDRANQANEAELKNHLGYLFSYLGTLARQLDTLSKELPAGTPLKNTLKNLIKSQLAPGFGRLIAYYKPNLKAGSKEELDPAKNLIAEVQPDFTLLGGPTLIFSTIFKTGLSTDWITDGAADWKTYRDAIPAQKSVYGTGTSVFEKANHLATHALFTSIFDQFLKAYARVVADAKAALEASLTSQDSHDPHYALFLAFLRLQEYVRQETNTLTARHLDFYYRDILRLREKPAEPAHAHILLELAKHVESHLLPEGELLKAGKDALKKDVFFANDQTLVANAARITDLKTVYRHNDEAVTGEGGNATKQLGRLYAAPVANSQDGKGAKLTSADGSWHPFFNKTYEDGKLTGIPMPKAEVGFAVASHYLYLTEGYRRITLNVQLTQTVSANASVTVYLTTEKGWHPVKTSLTVPNTKTATLFIELEADAPAILPYVASLHGGDFQTGHPIMKVVLDHAVDQLYDYAELEAAQVESCTISVSAGLDSSGNLTKPGIKSPAVSSDFGPVDSSKPFQPFGPNPKAGSAFIIGSKEIFQKANASVKISFNWRGTFKATPSLSAAYLSKAVWSTLASSIYVNGSTTALTIPTAGAAPIDYSPNDFLTNASVTGFLKISANGDFGYAAWQTALATYFSELAQEKTPALPTVPEAPEITAINLGYSATSAPIPLNSTSSKDASGAKFYHLSPFGMAERHPQLTGNGVTTLLPQFSHAGGGVSQLHEAEFYIGLSGLLPPRSLSLLIQVADGTADPNSVKTQLHWSYLYKNNWVDFPADSLSDTTNDFTRSGIVTLAIPAEATATNTLLPTGRHWIRVAVADASEGACRLLAVAAQAARVTFADRDNDPAFPATVLPAGTINKLDQPDSAVKKVEQPFETFGGRGPETSESFYNRISERLRHKDRGIALWDYERLVLEAFPQIYKAKCLNHTHYEPGIYKELAPGHVTLVTIPNQQFQNQRDPLKPYTSLGLLTEIDAFLKARLSCFVKLHVKNPQFEGVRVSFRVRLFDGYDETFYIGRLQEAITRFLSPWAFAGGEGPSFGGKIYKSVLINFVEEQPYVDYVTDFQLFHDINDVPGAEDKQEVEGSKAISILVSVPAKLHTISAINPTEDAPSAEQCPCEA
ncbi:baseplate J/gp47 family protein [Spirosoma fluviale]|uniref:Baseplate J-like protein n=1 Tax=Spirosoma fluviale TaxID=1597977 RepID=A0A286GBG2_9BACT|nr:baseplate J/gp47 family protein [Spirosoma fluviale]SOD92832.1 Baseplate J-like protein [Spirosoma fluviale]